MRIHSPTVQAQSVGGPHNQQDIPGNDADLAQNSTVTIPDKREKAVLEPTSLTPLTTPTTEHGFKEERSSKVDEIFNHVWQQDELEAAVDEESTSQFAEESPHNTEDSSSRTSGPWQFSVPKDYEKYDRAILFWSGDDIEDSLLQSLMGEFADVPCTQPESPYHLAIPFAELAKGITRDSWLTIAVYLPMFFEDDTDACYVVRGRKLHTDFVKGVWGTGPWKGRCFITPMDAYNMNSLFGGISYQARDMVTKSEFRGKRHRYLFESAVEAWKHVELDPNASIEHSDDSEVEKMDPDVVGPQAAAETSGNTELRDDAMTVQDDPDEDDEMDIDDTELLDGRCTTTVPCSTKGVGRKDASLTGIRREEQEIIVRPTTVTSYGRSGALACLQAMSSFFHSAL
ncbi:hypothetical protein BU16DRAFT_558088 [Lophium mytilinum]|uniref:Uncharacterized protein n=1 Tax=Lophium mytilinum TaxID=390894 RepID=A0A6A6R601_9PEZI|nr:hypothetical protein BU16DRAFT_558088 [Lophium mytilinum]